jgi:hypothetical protein
MRKSEWLNSGGKYWLSDETYESMNWGCWMLLRLD